MRITFDVIRRAHSISNTLGFRRAAGFLRNRGVSFEAAFYILFAREPRI